MKKYIFTAIVALLVGVVIGYATHGNSSVGGAASPVGSNQSEQSYFQTSLTPTTTTGTSTAILNSSYDRAVTDGFAFCTGVTKADTGGLATLVLTAATATAATTVTNTNYALNLTIATTSATVYAASTTAPVSDVWRVWPAGTYLVFAFNATDTAACTFGVHYMQL